MNDQSENSKRKPYAQPQLTVVGSVRLVTKTANSMGQPDGGSMGANTKTI